MHIPLRLHPDLNLVHKPAERLKPLGIMSAQFRCPLNIFGILPLKYLRNTLLQFFVKKSLPFCNK